MSAGDFPSDESASPAPSSSLEVSVTRLAADICHGSLGEYGEYDVYLSSFADFEDNVGDVETAGGEVEMVVYPVDLGLIGTDEGLSGISTGDLGERGERGAKALPFGDLKGNVGETADGEEVKVVYPGDFGTGSGEVITVGDFEIGGGEVTVVELFDTGGGGGALSEEVEDCAGVLSSATFPTLGSENLGARVERNDPMPAPHEERLGLAGAAGALGVGSIDECFPNSKGRAV